MVNGTITDAYLQIDKFWFSEMKKIEIVRHTIEKTLKNEIL